MNSAEYSLGTSLHGISTAVSENLSRTDQEGYAPVVVQWLIGDQDELAPQSHLNAKYDEHWEQDGISGVNEPEERPKGRNPFDENYLDRRDSFESLENAHEGPLLRHNAPTPGGSVDHDIFDDIDDVSHLSD